MMNPEVRMNGVKWLLLLGLFTTLPLTKLTQAQRSRNRDSPNTTRLLNKLLGNMDPRVRPQESGPPVTVKCGFYIISFGSISEVNMDYTMDIYMRMVWTDNRMGFDEFNTTLVLPAKSMEEVWTPDLFFPNEKSASFHDVTVPNKLMRVHPNGTIVYSVRITLTLSCSMLLTHFPMDYQECFVKLESYGYETNQMILEWLDEDPVEVSEDLEMPQFDMYEYGAENCVKKYKTGNFPCLQARFSLKRQFGFYLLQTYIPSILIVVLSWVSFWINVEAVPARISLGVTTVLTMTTQLSGSRQSIPRVSYPKAIDVWMSMCMIFVFGALIEYAFVNVMVRKSKVDGSKYKKSDDPIDIKDDKVAPAEGDAAYSRVFMPFHGIRQKLKDKEKANIVDKISRVLFPSAFLIFNIIYWIVYTRSHLPER